MVTRPGRVGSGNSVCKIRRKSQRPFQEQGSTATIKGGKLFLRPCLGLIGPYNNWTLWGTFFANSRPCSRRTSTSFWFAACLRCTSPRRASSTTSGRRHYTCNWGAGSSHQKRNWFSGAKRYAHWTTLRALARVRSRHVSSAFASTTRPRRLSLWFWRLSLCL